MAEIAIVRFSLKLVWGLIANRAISSLQHGDVADEKLRQLLLSEFRKIHEQLNALRRKELVAATAFMENGYELMKEDIEEAVKEFNKARDAAQMAFGVVSDDHDKVLATKIMVASALHEFAEKPATAVSLCVKYVTRLNTLPEVANACAVTLGYKFGSKLRMMSGSATRQELLKNISEINRCVWQFANTEEGGKWRESPWPAIQFGEHYVNPITNLILFRGCHEVTTLPDDFGTAVTMVEAEAKLFFAQSLNSAEEEDKLLQHALKVLDLETKKVSDLVGHTGLILTLVKCDGFVLSGSFDKNVLVWDCKTLKCAHILSGHEGSVRSLAVNASHIFSGSTDATIRMWDRVTFELCRTLDAHVRPIAAIAVNNRYIFCAAVSGGIRIWDLRTYSCLHEVEVTAQAANVAAIHFLHNLALVHCDSSISVLNLGNLKQIGTITGAGKVSQVVGSHLCSSAESTLKGWDISSFKSTSCKSFKNEQEALCINCMCYSKETGHLYLAATNTGGRRNRNVVLRL